MEATVKSTSSIGQEINGSPRMCARCVLTSAFPGIRFNEHGVCDLCLSAGSPEETFTRRERLMADIDEVIEQYRGNGEYECIVAYSGGKDSSNTLKFLVERYGLRCLAVTVDNGFIAEQAVENCKTVTAALGVDLLFYRPSPVFMNDLYLKSATTALHAPAAIKRASSMCNSCISLINNYMIKTALQHNVKIIAGGYIGGQIPTDAAVMRMKTSVQSKLRGVSLKRYVTALGPAAEKYMGFPDVTDDSELVIVNPMLGLGQSEEQVIENISSIGWQRVTSVGLNSSNCQLNDLGIAVHHKQHGFHPYALEASEQIRAGLMTRAEALKKVERIPEFSDLRDQIAKIGLHIL